MVRLFLLVMMIAGIVSCSTTRQSGTHDLSEGSYRLRKGVAPVERVYLVITDSSLAIHPYITHTKQPDPVPYQVVSFTPLITDSLSRPFMLTRKSIDIDLTTILLKYRFSNHTLPNQLSNNLNAALYAGFRMDYFRITDQLSPLRVRKRDIRHFEFDLGLFAGIGSTAVNSSTTANEVDVEYDGVVFQKGIAFFIGSHRFTLGLGIGTDGLLDSNRKTWIYQEKPWLGLMIGLNLTN